MAVMGGDPVESEALILAVHAESMPLQKLPASLPETAMAHVGQIPFHSKVALPIRAINLEQTKSCELMSPVLCASLLRRDRVASRVPLR